MGLKAYLLKKLYFNIQNVFNENESKIILKTSFEIYNTANIIKSIIIVCCLNLKSVLVLG